MSQETILILTAGYWQRIVIERAKALGLRTVVTDIEPNAPSALIADEFVCIDSCDIEGIVRIAEDRNVSGVIAEQSDVAVVTGAAVSERCRLPGIGTDVARRATNKELMRNACVEAGILVPRYRCTKNLTEAIGAAEDIGFPLVVKPTDSQSSKGVAKVWEMSDIPSRFTEALRQSREGKVLIEEMLTGVECSVEAYVTNGEQTILGISEKTKSPPPYCFDTRLIYPAKFSNETMCRLSEVNDRVVRALGVPLGITHTEYILTSKGPYLLEAAARGCGSGVASILLPALTGFDPIDARIKAALGEKQSAPTLNKSRFGILEFLMLPEGTISSISGLEAAANVPGVLAVDYFARPGDTITAARNCTQRPGYCLAVGDSYGDLYEKIIDVKSKLAVTINS